MIDINDTGAFLVWVNTAPEGELLRVFEQLTLSENEFGRPEYTTWDETRYNRIARRLGLPEHKTDPMEMRPSVDTGVSGYSFTERAFVQYEPPRNCDQSVSL